MDKLLVSLASMKLGGPSNYLPISLQHAGKLEMLIIKNYSLVGSSYTLTLQNSNR